MGTEWLPVQDLPEGGRDPMLLTQPADSGRMMGPHIFSVVLGPDGTGLCRTLDTNQAPGPNDAATQTCLPRALPSIIIITTSMSLLL